MCNGTSLWFWFAFLWWWVMLSIFSLETQTLNDTMDQLDLIDIYRTFHPKTIHVFLIYLLLKRIAFPTTYHDTSFPVECAVEGVSGEKGNWLPKHKPLTFPPSLLKLSTNTGPGNFFCLFAPCLFSSGIKWAVMPFANGNTVEYLIYYTAMAQNGSNRKKR